MLIEIECQENFHYSSELPILRPAMILCCNTERIIFLGMPAFLIYIIPKNVRVTLKFFIFEKMKNTKKTSSTIQSIIQAVLNGEERVFCCGPNQGRPTLRMSNLRLPFTYFPFKSRHIIFVWRFCFILFRTNTFCGPNHKNTD